METYKEEGYTEREAAQKIVSKNLHGLDIDKRAAQLAYFSLMMKGRSFDRRFLTRSIEPNIMDIKETNNIEEFECAGITNNPEMNKIGNYLLNIFKDAKEYGSLIKVESLDYASFEEYLNECEKIEGDVFAFSWKKNILPLFRNLVKLGKILSNKYKIVGTNPPYLNKFEGNLKKFITKEYKAFKGDLFSAFIFRNFEFLVENGYSGFMTPNVWMFIKSYEELRNYIINHKRIDTLIQIAKGAFYKEATVDVMAFVLQNSENDGRKGLYIRLEDFKGDMEVQKEKVLEALENKELSYFYETSEENFTKIPGMPIAYWINEIVINNYRNSSIKRELNYSGAQNKTANNDKYIRKLWEISINNSKWQKLTKGGAFRKWSGNIEEVIDWSEGAKLYYESNKTSCLMKEKFLFKEGITWTKISSVKNGSFRYIDNTVLYETASPTVHAEKNIFYYLGLLNSKVGDTYIGITKQTLNFQVNDIINIPNIVCEIEQERIGYLAKQNINISKFDWDTFETSWDFKVNPLANFNGYLEEYYGLHSEEGKVFEREDYNINNIENAYNHYKNFTNNQFEKLKGNEEELNRIFIDIYGLQDELRPEVSDRDITIAKIFDKKSEIDEEIKGNKYVLTKEDIVKQFISYAVGCMFGRYSLEEEGLAYAGGDFNIEKYSEFIPDMDNCIPITDSKYFDDDIVTRFEDFVEKVYGSETLEENLNFVASAIGGKGESREIIRNYFIKDFYKDHVKRYQKRPIYWQYESGKQNGFKALVYMHRYNEYTTGKVRTEYLHKLQGYYSDRISLIEMDIANDNSLSNKKKSEEERIKIQKQLDECKKYDESIGHIAGEKIAIDLDDGVKVNYEKVQTDRDGKVLKILSKI